MPLAKGYKDPLQPDDVSQPAQSVGPLGQTDDMPPARPLLDPPQPVQAPNFRMSDIPMSTDASGRNQVDYAELAKRMYQKNAGQYDDNQVSREDLQNSHDQNVARSLMTGFANAAAKAGGTESTVGATAKALNDEDNSLLNSRKALANEGYDRGINSLNAMQKAPLEMQQNRQLMDANDPNSQLSQFSRDFYKKIIPGGKALPDNMSAADISKFSPDIVKVAAEQANRNFQMQMFGAEKNFQSKQAQQAFANQQQMHAQQLEQQIALQQLRGNVKPVNMKAAQLEGQGKAMQTAHGIVEQIEAGGANPYSDVKNLASHYSPFQALKTDDIQRLENAEKNFAAAAWKAQGNARPPTPQQSESLIKNLFRQPGDTDALAEQKKQKREALIGSSLSTAAKSMYGPNAGVEGESETADTGGETEGDYGHGSIDFNAIPTWKPPGQEDNKFSNVLKRNGLGT